MHYIVCYDQLNIGNLASAEAAAREVQTQEMRYAERITGQHDEMAERSILAGSSSIGNLCIMPALREHLRVQLAGRNDIAKERRKAREERHLQRPNKGKKGKKDEGGDGG